MILLREKDHSPIYKRYPEEIDKRNSKVLMMKEKLSKEQMEKDQLLLEEIERMQIHKPGKKYDLKSFENQYREKVERWNRRFRVAEEMASF